MPAEQDRHTYAVAFFPLDYVFLQSEDSVPQLDGRPLSHKNCLEFSIELWFDTELGDDFHKFAQIYIF